MKLLIVEDERELSQSMYAYLNSEKYTCEQAYDYHDAIEKVLLNDYACVILDLGLPYGDGIDVLKTIKKENKQDGIIIISAKNSTDDKVLGLQIGADDFLSKPFHLSELEARVAAIIRRKSFDGKNKIELDNLTLDLQEKKLKGITGNIELTRMEYMLLEYFICNNKRVTTKEAIAEHLCGEDNGMADNHDFIYSHIKNLRKKLKASGSNDTIKTVYGMGYKFYSANL